MHPRRRSLQTGADRISRTTDMAAHPGLANRRTTKTVDGRSVTGWFTEDFTPAELRTLWAVERLPSSARPGAAVAGAGERGWAVRPEYADWIGPDQSMRRGTGANGFRDVFAEYALYYRLGGDAVVTGFPDLAVTARRG